MIPLRTLTLALAAALASGCTMIPEYQRPAAPVAASFPNTAPAAEATPADAIAWRDYFADTQLREVIALALANNRDLRVAALNIEKTRAQYRIQRADLFPAVGASGGMNAQRLPADLSSSGDAGVNRSYSATIGFSAYELDFFGRIRSLNAQALETYLGTEEAQRSAQISLVAEVANTWLTLAADRERLALASSTYETRQKSYDLTRRIFEAGAVSALDLRQAETLLHNARADAARYRSFVAQDENALALIIGAPVPRCPGARRTTTCHAERQHQRGGRIASRRAVRGAHPPPRHPAGRTRTACRQRQHRRRARRLLPQHQPDCRRRQREQHARRPV